MFVSLCAALITVAIGVVPSLIGRNFKATAMIGFVGLPIFLAVYYIGTPAFVYPFFGAAAVGVLVCWISSAILGALVEDEGKTNFAVSVVVAILLVALMMGGAVVGCGMFRAHDYSQLIGEVEQREWTKDVQPKDPKHVRLVTHELAYYLATKQLGEVKGAVGSQFQINKDQLTLQLINDELWYVAPLDYSDFTVWTSADSAPGYVMVHAEDPNMPVVVKTGCKFRFMPGAYFGDNLERHIWEKSVTKYGLTDFSFEIDEAGNPWWVVTAFKPTIMWWGEKTCGVYIVNPTNGDTVFYPIGEVPNWVDRVVPKDYVKSYAEMRGTYSGGWFNSWWGSKDLTEPEEPTLVYGSDGRPYWVTAITSKSDADTSLIGLIYTETQTGKSVEYHAIGGTEKAIVDLVNNKVSFRKLHGSGPVLYNIYGVMTSIVPLLGESHSFQGVAMVDVANMQLAVGDDIESTLRQYQKVIMSGSAQKLAPEKAHELQRITGLVDRVTPEVSGNETVYYIHVQDCPHIFSGGVGLSPKLRMAERGDQVVIGFVQSNEDILPMADFDLPKLVLTRSKNQEQLGQRVAERQAQEKSREDSRDARAAISNMSDEELRALMELKRKSGN